MENLNYELYDPKQKVDYNYALHEPDLPSDLERQPKKAIDPKLVEKLARKLIKEHKLTQTPY